MIFSANVTVIFKKMLRFIESEIKNNDYNNSFNDRDIIAFVDDVEFNSIIRGRKKLTR